MQDLKAYTLIGLASSRAGASGSFKAWTLARFLDRQNGRDSAGRVLASELHELIETYYSTRTRQRWIKEAVQLGVLIPYTNGEYYKYIRPDRIALIYECPAIKNPVWLSLDVFMSRAWRGELWAGYLEQRNSDKPISRAALESITGVLKVSQLEYEQETEKIKVHENLVLLERVNDKAKTIKQLKESPERKGIKLHKGRLVKQLPNVYVTNGVRVCKKGSTGIYRRHLKNALSNNVQRVSMKVKLYYKSQKPAQKASEKHGIIKYFHQNHDPQGVNWWGECVPC